MVLRTLGDVPTDQGAVLPPRALTYWPQDAEVLERVEPRSCVRRGAAIDLTLDQGRENRSQIVFTTVRVRDAGEPSGRGAHPPCAAHV